MLRTSTEPHSIARVRLPVAEEDAKAAVLVCLDELRDALPQLQVTCSDRFRVLLETTDVPYYGESLMLSIPLVETCLDREPDDVGPELLAQLAFLSLFPAVPEQVALQIAFGWRIADEYASEFAPVLEQERAGGALTEGYPPALDWEGEAFDTEVAALFRGESWRGPESPRVARGIALLRRAAAHAPDGLRPPLLGIVAWLLWASGKRPHALAYLATASRDGGDVELVEALTEHLGSNAPLWLKRPQTVPQAMPTVAGR